MVSPWYWPPAPARCSGRVAWYKGSEWQGAGLEGCMNRVYAWPGSRAANRAAAIESSLPFLFRSDVIADFLISSVTRAGGKAAYLPSTAVFAEDPFQQQSANNQPMPGSASMVPEYSPVADVHPAFITTNPFLAYALNISPPPAPYRSPETAIGHIARDALLSQVTSVTSVKSVECTTSVKYFLARVTNNVRTADTRRRCHPVCMPGDGCA